MNDHQLPDDHADRIRCIISGLRETLALLDVRPMDTIVIGDLLRGIKTHAEVLTVDFRFKPSKDGTSISAGSAHLLLERHVPVFASSLVRLQTRTGEALTETETTLRKQAGALLITVDSLLASSTFAGVPGGRAA